MAKKETKKTPINEESSSKITRISAKDTEQKPEMTTKKKAKEKKRTKFGTYLRGAWSELKMVRWPDRATTWKMTGTLLLFCLFFIVLVLLVDMLFQLLFNQIIG